MSTASIGSLVASLIQQQGAEAARAREATGAIWGGAIRDIGQGIQQSIATATDPKRQEWLRQQQGRAALTQAIKTTPAGADGAPDHQAIVAKVSAAGFPDLGEAWLSTATKNAENLSSLEKMKRDAVTAAQTYQQKQIGTIGDAAFHADTPDKFLASVGYLAAHGQLDEKTANGVLDQAQQAGPDGWQAVRQTFLQHSPAWLKQQDELQKPVTLPPTPEGAAPATVVIPGAPAGTAPLATGATSQPKPKTEIEIAADAANPKSPTAAQSKATLDMLQAAKQAPVGGELKFGRVGGQGPVIAAVFDPRSKTLTYQGKDVTNNFQAPVDPAERLASTQAAAIAQQARSQDFETKKQARGDIDKINKDFLTARTSADTLRDVVASAEAGNKVSGSLQSLEATMAAIRGQGLNRINSAEIGATANAGSLWDNIVGWFGKKVDGQPVPPAIQKDMKAFADILDKAAYKKYGDAHDATNTLYGTTIPRTFTPPASTMAAPPTLTPGLQGLANR